MASLPPGADSDQLLVEENGSTRTLIMNRPKQLNALSSAMIMELLRCFTAYEKDDKVKLLIMKVPDTTVFLLSFIVDVIKLGIYIYVYVLFSALVI